MNFSKSVLTIFGALTLIGSTALSLAPPPPWIKTYAITAEGHQFSLGEDLTSLEELKSIVVKEARQKGLDQCKNLANYKSYDDKGYPVTLQYPYVLLDYGTQAAPVVTLIILDNYTLQAIRNAGNKNVSGKAYNASVVNRFSCQITLPMTK